MILEHKEHPIERIMDNAMSKLKGLISSDTVIGEPVRTADGLSLIPITKVTMGFLTGGGEYNTSNRESNFDYPFAGGSGAGISVSPIGFLVSDGKSIKIINIDDKNAFERLLELVPEVVGGFFNNSQKDCKKK